jgi:propanediol dehydratase small subunit
MIKTMESAVAARRKDVAANFASKAISLEKDGKHKQAAISFNRAAILTDEIEEQALILYSSFRCYKAAMDYGNARQAITAAAEKYKAAEEEPAADICMYELGKLSDTKSSLRVNKGLRSVLSGCFSDKILKS